MNRKWDQCTNGNMDADLLLYHKHFSSFSLEWKKRTKEKESGRRKRKNLEERERMEEEEGRESNWPIDGVSKSTIHEARSSSLEEEVSESRK